MSSPLKLNINIDKSIIYSVLLLIIVKLTFSYLNVELDWWQRHLTPNIEKYNFFGLSDKFTRQLEYLIIPLLLVYLLKNFNYIGRFIYPLFIILTLLMLNLITSFLTKVPLLNSLEYTIKFSAPILFFICLHIQNKKYGFSLEKVIKAILIYCFFLVIIGILVFDPSYNHWENWLPIYFTSLHTHNYILVGLSVAIMYYLYSRRKYYWLCTFLGFFFFFLFFGYNIRSALFFYLVVLIGFTYVIHDFFKVLWVKILITIPIIVAFYISLNSSFDLNRFSSGRVTMYKAKIEMLKGYDLSEYLFGRGKGSDFIRTEDWWYADKNSHNDVLTFLVENGILYALLFILLLLSLTIYSSRINIISLSIVLGYLSASFLSNGLPLRPLAGYILFLVFAYVQIDMNQRKKLSNNSSKKLAT